MDNSSATEWSLKRDILDSLNDGLTLEKFDETGLYEKYIANKKFEDIELKAMTDAGFISENLLEKFLVEILTQYPELASEVTVPHEFSDKSNAMLSYQRVIKFRKDQETP